MFSGFFMSELNLQAACQEFTTYVQAELQNKEHLQGCAIEHDNVGTDFHVPVLGDMNLIKMGESAKDFNAGNIPVVNVSQRDVSIKPEPYKVKSVLSHTYLTAFKFNLLQEHARAAAKGIGRFNDYLKLKSVLTNEYSSANNNEVAVSKDKEKGLTSAKISDARFMLAANGASTTELSLWINAASMGSLVKDEHYANFFYSNQKPYTIAGQMPPVMGIDLRTLEQVGTNTDVDNTIPIDSSGNTAAYLVPRDELFVIYNERPMVKIHDNPGEHRIDLVGVGTGNSGIIHKQGIIKININVK